MCTLVTIAQAHPVPKGYTRVYLCRHGETNYNLQGRFQGRGIDSELNENGIAQAQALGNALKNIPLRAIFSSKLSRAKATAAKISQYHPNTSIGVIDGIEEMGYGDNEGKYLAQSKHLLKDVIDRWNEGNFDIAWPQGESARDVEKRGTTALLQLLKDHPTYEQIALVCHGRFNRVLLSSVLYQDLRKMEDIEQDNTCVNILDFDHATETFHALVLNNTDHRIT
ncbi:hypothetical protein THRCLA_05183 [Thraustotheca clavata]|uniref:Phosphoglycerate mutase n=1 Tax=Thraustotheca clavata TaxID=74557 RepID=A0A1V9ZWQ2_9STRA|nr:hypothetical protein THRCLA_05183 [Thraustotheca clavata]